MCMCGGPTPLGIFISQLQPGEQVIILKGEGNPPVPEETVDVICQVERFSALTAGGIRLNCLANSDIISTGTHVTNFEVSDSAKEIVNKAALDNFELMKMLLEDEDADLDWSAPTVPNEPE